MNKRDMSLCLIMLSSIISAQLTDMCKIWEKVKALGQFCIQLNILIMHISFIFFENACINIISIIEQHNTLSQTNICMYIYIYII